MESSAVSQPTAPQPGEIEIQKFWYRNLILLWIGTFLTAVSFSLIMPFLPVFMGELGVSEGVEWWAGITFGAAYLASAVMSPIWGSLADKYGRKVMIIRSGISIGVVYLLMSYTTNPWQLLTLRFINGAMSGFIPSAIALVATNTPENRVGRTLAVLQTGIASGNILGPVIGGALSDAVGLRPSMRVAAVVIFLATVLVIFGVKESKLGRATERSNIIQDFATAFAIPALATLLVSQVMYQFSIMSLEPILTPFIKQLTATGDVPAWVQGAIFSLPGVAVIIAAPAWVRLGERRGYGWVMATTMLVGALLVLPQGLSRSPWEFALLRFGQGIVLAAIPPCVNAIIATKVDRTFRGRAYGINTSASFIGSVFGPVLGGFIGTHIGRNWVFVATGLLLMASGLWARRKLLQTDRETKEQAA